MKDWLRDGIQSESIAATPGYFIVHPCGDGGGHVRIPIVAWRVPSDGSPAYPVLFDSDPEAHWGILCPSGQVVVPADAVFDDLNAFLMHCRQYAATGGISRFARWAIDCRMCPWWLAFLLLRLGL
jgi:hypothetical protein